MGLKTTGIYHTDFVQYVRCLTQDDDLADLTWRFMQWFYEQTDTILVPTEFYRQELLRQGFDVEKLKVMSRGVDAALFHPDKRDPARFERYGLNGGFKFLYVGRVSREKNLDGLVAAFDRLRQRGHDAQLVIVGDGPYRAELQSRCREQRVVFTGLLEGEELATAYASADVLVFPSATDTFGNVVLEAAGLGPAGDRDGSRGPGGDRPIARVGAGRGSYATGATGRRDGRTLPVAPSAAPNCAPRVRNAAGNAWEQVLATFWADDATGPAESARAAFRTADTRVAPGVIALDLA